MNPPRRYADPHKKAEFTPEERKFILDLIREAEENCDPNYASSAAGFWLHQQAAPEMRSYA